MFAVFQSFEAEKEGLFQPMGVSIPIPKGGNNHLTQIRGNQTRLQLGEAHIPGLGGEPQEEEMRGG